MSSNNQYPDNNEQYYDDEREKQEEDKKKKKKISKTQLFKRTLFGVLACGGIVLVIVNSCRKSKSEDNKIPEPQPNTKKESIEETKVIGGTEEITSATVKEDGTVTLNSDDAMDDNSINTETSNPTETIEETTEASISDTEVEQIPQVNRTVVTAEDVKVVVNNYYTYLNTRVEDPANMVDVGSVYSLAFMANCQYISVEECNKLINEGLIPSDLTTIQTESMNNISLILSENCTKAAVADAFGTELDVNKLIDFSNLFIDETDRNVSKKAFDEFTKLVQSDKSSINSIFENTIKFIDNATKYSFDEIGSEAKHFNHDYPVDFAQTSVGAQYLVKGIVGREFVWYATSKSIITENESEDLYQLINTVDSTISYIDNKFYDGCITNEPVKTYVK